MAIYVDTSALVTLVAAEAESEELRSWLEGSDDDLVTCDLARTELMRAVRRATPDRATLARQVLDTFTLLQVRPTLSPLARAASSHPPSDPSMRFIWRPLSTSAMTSSRS